MDNLTFGTKNQYDKNTKRGRSIALFIGITVLVGLYLISLVNYEFFHTLLEIITVVIVAGVFLLTWNVRNYLTNNYLKIIGFCYGFIAIIDLFHALTYGGVNLIPGYGANSSIQFWMAEAYLLSITTLIASFLLGGRRLNDYSITGYFTISTLVLFIAIYLGYFPDCFIVGKGLTSFKVYSEYAVIVILIISLFPLYRKRDQFNKRVFNIILSSLILTIIAEFFFSGYTTLFDLANLAGHMFKGAAYCLIYQAIFVTGLREPFNIVFRDLKQTEQELRDHQETLEDRIGERTASLQAEVAERKRAEESLLRLNRELRAISNCNQALVRAEDEQTLLADICRIICDDAGYRMAWVGYAENDDAKSIRPVAWGGVEEGYLQQADIVWADTERGRGPTGIAIRTGKTDCMRDFTTDPKAAPWRENALQRGYRSSIALPLKDEVGNVFGALTIYSTEPNAFDETEEMRLLEELAGDMAFGITVLRARKSRREAERRIALLTFALDNVREAAYLTDEKAHFHYVNEETSRVLGYTRDELLTMGVADIDPDFPPERWPGHWEELKTRRSLTFEGRHRAKGGRIFPVEINANYIEYDGQGHNLALVRDITERKHAETKLKEQLFFLQQLLDSIPIPVYYKDVDGVYLGCNAPFETLVGMPRSEIVGKTVYEVLPKERADIHHEADLALLRNPGVQIYEVSGIYHDGKFHHVIFNKATFLDADNRVAGIVGASIDITERKRVEEEIHKLNEELRRLNEELEERVKRRTAELEEKNKELSRMNKLFVGRELRMVELKEKIKELEKASNKG